MFILLLLSAFSLYGMERQVVEMPNFQSLAPQVSRICAEIADHAQALNNVDKLIPPLLPQEVQISLISKMLTLSSFTCHVDSIVEKIKDIFDAVTEKH